MVQLGRSGSFAGAFKPKKKVYLDDLRFRSSMDPFQIDFGRDDQVALFLGVFEVPH